MWFTGTNLQRNNENNKKRERILTAVERKTRWRRLASKFRMGPCLGLGIGCHFQKNTWKPIPPIPPFWYVIVFHRDTRPAMRQNIRKHPTHISPWIYCLSPYSRVLYKIAIRIRVSFYLVARSYSCGCARHLPTKGYVMHAPAADSNATPRIGCLMECGRR